MTFPDSWSLRRRLFALAIAAVLPVALLAVISLGVLRGQQTDRIRASMETTARAVMTAVDRQIEKSVHALEALGTARSLRAADMPAFYEDAERVLAREPTWITLAVFSASGEYLFNLRQPLGAALPQVPASIESMERAIQSRRPQVSRLLVGKLTPEPFIALSVPIMRDGAVTHVR